MNNLKHNAEFAKESVLADPATIDSRFVKLLNTLSNDARASLIDVFVARGADRGMKTFFRRALPFIFKDKEIVLNSEDYPATVALIALWVKCRKDFMAQEEEPPACKPLDVVDLTHQLLEKHIPGAAVKPYMLVGVDNLKGHPYAATNCYYHTAVFMGDAAYMFSREEGGMVPWQGSGDGMFPDIQYFDKVIDMPAGSTNEILAAIAEKKMQQELLAEIGCEKRTQGSVVSHGGPGNGPL